MSIRLFCLLASAAALVAPLHAQPVPRPDDSAADVLGYAPDDSQRMTVPVSIGGKGPYRFIVDTGAERTVIARELAHELRLGPGDSTILHSMTEVQETPTVLIPRLEVSRKTVRDIHAPALARAHLGAEGMLGVDSLQAQRVLFDFVRQEMSISPSRVREPRWDSDTIVVTARSRFGHLILVDAAVDGEKVNVILDTGSQVTIGNNALRRKLAKKGKLRFTVPISLLSVTGGVTQADYTAVKKLRLGGVDITDMPIAFAEVHPFRKLKLTDKPALLLGMDALKLFERVSVDFATRKVRLLPPGTAQADQPRRYAGRLVR
ncbi:retroviral-like aspartic protease family protein [Sphingomonas sp. LY54]|uniref:retroviral-like aspartic protease family protein n=1 Tax=Sphingomonas sp. LY54 TaxID=3095343 RepID=UPI002D76F66B|nr:retroviral-like aspartic protease family protein [Sphingomonas sp. LY54]WRP29564.1 retroviral-like aspartic protease family protein [Sphingomonas sp. LY54]